uniref:hypothetical protein n=1 Tax=Chryseobacterium sp. TaxID=1871047 RepID=UPI00321A1150
ILSEQYLKPIDGNLKPDKNALENTDAVEKTLDLFDIPEELENLTFKELMRETYKDMRYSLFSNSGYKYNPSVVNDDFVFDSDTIIVIKDPFKILYKDSLNKEKVHVFVRGIKFELNNFQCIKDVIDEINEGQEIAVGQLFDILDEDWDMDIKQYILNLFYKHNGIKIVN